MKTDLQIEGRVELTHLDISKAIGEWLAAHYNYKVEKVVYLGQITPAAIAEIVGSTTANESVQAYNAKEIETRNSEGGFRRENIGIFDLIRSVLNEKFVKNGRVETLVQYKFLREEIFFHFHKMDDKKLRIYLCDSRQFPNTKWSAKENHMVVRSIINR